MPYTIKGIVRQLKSFGWISELVRRLGAKKMITSRPQVDSRGYSLQTFTTRKPSRQRINSRHHIQISGNHSLYRPGDGRENRRVARLRA
jgi:hypothetical protein